MQIGTRLGPYEILAPLKTGGMDEVWRASDTRLDRVVALKVLPEAFVKDVGSHPHLDEDGAAGGNALTRAVNHAQLQHAELLTALCRSRHLRPPESAGRRANRLV